VEGHRALAAVPPTRFHVGVPGANGHLVAHAELCIGIDLADDLPEGDLEVLHQGAVGLAAVDVVEGGIAIVPPLYDGHHLAVPDYEGSFAKAVHGQGLAEKSSKPLRIR
jgi:hypothetical protein